MLQSGVKSSTFDAKFCNGIVYFCALQFEFLFVI
jgi:hypothetical protein